jgi:HD-like signal output (HDOD) protein
VQARPAQAPARTPLRQPSPVQQVKSSPAKPPQVPAAQAAAPASSPTSTDERVNALAFLQHLATEVSKGNVNLPCFPDVVIRIRQALGDPETPVGKTVSIVGAEPRLAARLLQTANSAMFNSSGRPVTELRTAITRLGNRLVQSAAMAFAIQQLRIAPALRAIGKPLKSLWEESVAVASICQVVARRSEVNPDEAFLAGLLHGIGRLYVMVRATDGDSALRLDESLLEMIDGWHPAIGKAVLENWGFSEAVAEAVSNQYEYDHGGKSPPDHTDVLVVGVVLAQALRDPASVSDVDISGIRSFQRLSLTPEDCRSVLKHTEHHIGALRAALGC